MFSLSYGISGCHGEVGGAGSSSPGVVVWIFPALAPVGTVAVTWVSESAEKLVALTPPKVTFAEGATPDAQSSHKPAWTRIPSMCHLSRSPSVSCVSCWAKLTVEGAFSWSRI
jgi:hypothetical protein